MNLRKVLDYVLRDGSRSFTGQVSGINPSADAHLATKIYVDSQLAGENHWDFESPNTLTPYIPNIDIDLHNGNLITNGLVDGVDVSEHDVATTGVHGIGSGDTIAGINDIAVNSNLSSEAQDAISKRHSSGSDDQTADTVPTEDSGISVQDALNTLESVSHVAATAGTGISVVGQQVTNTDLGSTAVNNHKDLDTGVHGIGSGDVVAGIDDIAVDGNLSAAAQDAISKRHTQNTDQYLDYGGANQSTAADVKDAVDKKHDRSHAIDSTLDHTGVSGAVENNLVSFNASGLPKDSGFNSADVLPDQVGHSGDFLTTNGSIPNWQAIDIPGFISQAFSGQTSINVAHNFGAYPVVNVVDSTGAVLIPLSIVHNTINDFTVTFSSAKSGWILATGGSTTSTRETSFGITLDGAGSVISTGAKGYSIIPFNCTIASWKIVADQSGDIVIDVKKGDFPAAGAAPTTASIIGSGGTQPTLSGAISDYDDILTGWTTSVTNGQVIEWEVVSCTTITRVNLILTCVIPTQASQSTAFGITIDGGDLEVSDGSKGYAIIPFDCAITGWKILGDVSGSVEVDVKKGTFPAGGATPTTASLIGSGGTKPSITTAFSASSTDVTGWTTAITEGDVIEWNIDSCTTITRLNLIITCNKT